MYLKIILDGKTYESIGVKGKTPADVAKTLFDEWDKVTKLQVDMPDGSIMLLGKDALRRAVVIVMP